MTTEDKKEILGVIKVLVVISLVVISSSCMDFSFLDGFYLAVIGCCFLQYLYQKTHHI